MATHPKRAHVLEAPNLTRLRTSGGGRTVWVSIKAANAPYKRQRYHTRYGCMAKPQTGWAQLPTFEGAAKWAGLVLCTYCARAEDGAGVPA